MSGVGNAAVEQNLSSSLNESRLFAPPAEFAARAHVPDQETYERLYRESVEQPERFWAKAAGELEWFAPWRASCLFVCREARDAAAVLPRSWWQCIDRKSMA